MPLSAVSWKLHKHDITQKYSWDRLCVTAAFKSVISIFLIKLTPYLPQTECVLKAVNSMSIRAVKNF